MVDLTGDFRWPVELLKRAGDLGVHVGEDVEVAIAEGVVQQHSVALGDGGWASDNVHDGNLFRVCAGHAVDGR